MHTVPSLELSYPGAAQQRNAMALLEVQATDCRSLGPMVLLVILLLLLLLWHQEGSGLWIVP